MELSHLADLIIVASFFGVLGAAAGHIIGKAVCWAIDKVMAWRAKRREEKENERTASGSGDPEQR